ncbi:MAG: hypothetical protein IJR93_00400 [Treponema sp.]|nr:hypothetical protein [Treponema sp.]
MNDKNKPEAKPAEQLVFSDDFMFGAVMRDEEICREALECLLGEKISQVEYSEPQKTIEPRLPLREANDFLLRRKSRKAVRFATRA